jgi:hypothetical protein
MKYTAGNYVAEPHEHVVLTGPIAGTVTTQDGTTYDVSAAAVSVDPDHAAEVAHLIGSRYAAEGHPNHDERTPFVYNAPDEFADYQPHPDNDTLEG